MASPKHPENFVSYRASTVSLSSVVTDLDRVQTALDLSTTAVDRANLRSQATLLRIQAAVTEGDAHFDKRRFDQALSSYQDAGTLILTLIDPQMGSKRSPRTWLDTPAITKTLQQVSGGLLGNLVPAALAVPPVALAKPIALSYQELGADPQTTLDAVEDVSADALALADVARAAVEQGRWVEADSLYQQALAKVPGTTPAEREARASLLLNLGAVQTQRSQPDAAITRLGEAEALFRGLNDDLGAAQALHNAALAHLRAGRAKEATESLTKARSLAGTASLRGLLAQGTAPASAPAPSRPTIPTGPIGFSRRHRRHHHLAGSHEANLRRHESTGVVDCRSPRCASLTRPVATLAPVGERIDLLASQLGTDDLQLKFRSLRNASESESLRIESPSQSKLQDFKRQLTVAAGDGMVTLAWDRQTGPAAAQLTTLWAQGHMAAKDPKRVGYRPDTLANFATTLPHLYHFVLPIKMGDCHYEIGEYEDAQAQFRRAAAYPSINRPLEAPDLWRRIAENVLAWGDSLYKNDLAQNALPIYRLLVLETDTAPASFLYTDASLSPTGTDGQSVAGGSGGQPAAAGPQPGHRRRPPAGAAPPAVSAGRPRLLRQSDQSDSALHVPLPSGGREVLRQSGTAGRAALHRVLRSLRERADDTHRARECPRAGRQGGGRGTGAGKGSESDARRRQAQRQPRRPQGAERAERAQRVQQHGLRGAAARRAGRPRQRVDRRRPAQPELRRGRSDLRRIEARGAAADDAAADRDLAGAPADADGEHRAGARGREGGGRGPAESGRGPAARRADRRRDCAAAPGARLGDARPVQQPGVRSRAVVADGDVHEGVGVHAPCIAPSRPRS